MHHSDHLPCSISACRANHGHCAVLNDRVAFVAMMHADPKEAFELPVHHAMEDLLAPAAMCLRALHDRDLRVGEVANQRGQPAAIDDVVGVDHGYDLSALVDLIERKVQRAGLKARPARQMEEAEILTEARHVVAHRLPARRVLGVVVDHQQLEVRIVQALDACNGCDHHFGRLIAASQVNRHKRLLGANQWCLRRINPLQIAAPEHLGELKALREQDRRHDRQGRDQHAERQPNRPSASTDQTAARSSRPPTNRLPGSSPASSVCWAGA